MSSITRHIFCQLLIFFILSLAGLTLLVTLGFGAREGLREGLPPLLILGILPYMLPETLGITLPAAMLFAVSTVYSDLSNSNELTAMKALGIHPWRAIQPAFMLGCIISLAAVPLYEVAAIWGRPNVKRVLVQSIAEIAYGKLRVDRGFKSPRLSVVVKEVRGRRLIDPVIMIHSGGVKATVRAEEAELCDSPENHCLSVHCYKGEVDFEGAARMRFKSEHTEIPFEDHTNRDGHRDWVSTRSIPGHIADARAAIAELQRELANPRLDETQRRQIDEQLARKHNHLCRLETEPFRRWSNAFSCLCFAMVGAPVAVRMRGATFLSAFFVCFVPILCVYYPLLMLSENLSTSGTLPPVSFWLANALMIVVGSWQLRQVARC